MKIESGLLYIILKLYKATKLYKNVFFIEAYTYAYKLTEKHYLYLIFKIFVPKQVRVVKNLVLTLSNTCTNRHINKSSRI